MLCSSCGHDNPRENRYCGMCGTPFPHRPLTVPDAQSTLTFSSAPLEVAPSKLPVADAQPLHPALSSTGATLEEPQSSPPDNAVSELPPIPFVAQPPDAHEAVPFVDAEPVATTQPPVETPVAEESQPVSPSEEIPVEAVFSKPPAFRDEPAAVPEQSLSPLTETAEPTPPTTVAQPEASAPAAPSPPEFRRPAPPTPPIAPRYEAPVAHVDAEIRKPFVIHRPPPPQSTEPPPDSAGMPTFQSVAEAAGAPPISPFEPPAEKNPDEARELQEFVAGFRYKPPAEAADELTMRSEVPVLDAEAPVTPSHPSFDDDVPPPPEAGPHPTGEEYYPPKSASTDRSRFLEVGTSVSAEPAQPKQTMPPTSFLGLDASSPETVPPLSEAGSPPRRHWLLWSSLAAVVAIFATLGFFEGRAQMTHAFRGPVEIVQQRYVALRHRLSELTAPAPAAPAETRATEVTPSSEPPAKPATEQPSTETASAQPKPADNPPAAVESATSSEQQPKLPPANAQPETGTESKAAAPVSPPPATPNQAPAEREAAKVIAPEKPAANAGPQPGRQELAKAMQARDPAATAAWLWKATARGNPEAPVRLADMYIKGKGVPHSCEQALVLLRVQAAKEDAPARNRLAALYANGTCVARDRVKAYQLMSSALAVDPTSEWAEQSRKELWQQMTPEERSQAERYH